MSVVCNSGFERWPDSLFRECAFHLKLPHLMQSVTWALLMTSNVHPVHVIFFSRNYILILTSFCLFLNPNILLDRPKLRCLPCSAAGCNHDRLIMITSFPMQFTTWTLFLSLQTFAFLKWMCLLAGISLALTVTINDIFSKTLVFTSSSLGFTRIEGHTWSLSIHCKYEDHCIH